MYCVKCGTKLGKGSLVCPNCGMQFPNLEAWQNVDPPLNDPRIKANASCTANAIDGGRDDVSPLKARNLKRLCLSNPLPIMRSPSKDLWCDAENAAPRISTILNIVKRVASTFLENTVVLLKSLKQACGTRCAAMGA